MAYENISTLAKEFDDYRKRISEISTVVVNEETVLEIEELHSGITKDYAKRANNLRSAGDGVDASSKLEHMLDEKIQGVAQEVRNEFWERYNSIRNPPNHVDSHQDLREMGELYDRVALLSSKVEEDTEIKNYLAFKKEIDVIDVEAERVTEKYGRIFDEDDPWKQPFAARQLEHVARKYEAVVRKHRPPSILTQHPYSCFNAPRNMIKWKSRKKHTPWFVKAAITAAIISIFGGAAYHTHAPTYVYNIYLQNLR